METLPQSVLALRVIVQQIAEYSKKLEALQGQPGAGRMVAIIDALETARGLIAAEVINDFSKID